jgi:hypothetical protein
VRLNVILAKGAQMQSAKNGPLVLWLMGVWLRGSGSTPQDWGVAHVGCLNVVTESTVRVVDSTLQSNRRTCDSMRFQTLPLLNLQVGPLYSPQTLVSPAGTNYC